MRLQFKNQPFEFDTVADQCFNGSKTKGNVKLNPAGLKASQLENCEGGADKCNNGKSH